MQGAAPHSPLTGVPGWIKDTEEEAIIRYARECAYAAVLAVIGVEYGRIVIGLAKERPDARLYAVELKPTDEYFVNLDESLIDPQPTLLIGDSKDYGRAWEMDKIDLLFVDGAHEYENVVGDIESWTPHVKSGGYILFHDVAFTAGGYIATQPDQNKAVSHFLHYQVAQAIADTLPSDFVFVERVDSLFIYRNMAAEQPEIVIPAYEDNTDEDAADEPEPLQVHKAARGRKRKAS